MAHVIAGSIDIHAAAVTSTAIKGARVGGIATTIDLDYGCDHTLAVTTYTTTAQTTIQDITGWSLSWMLKRSLADADASAVVTKTTSAGITIAGTYHQNPTSNTQVASVALSAANLTLDPGTYWWELKRTDSNHETRLAYGNCIVGQTVHRT